MHLSQAPFDRESNIELAHRNIARFYQTSPFRVPTRDVVQIAGSRFEVVDMDGARDDKLLIRPGADGVTQGNGDYPIQ
jgi:CBS domain containing-hemolysin-like protein